MIRKIGQILCATVLALSFLSINGLNKVNAANYSITSLDELKEEIIKLNEIPNLLDGSESSEKVQKREEILSNTMPEVLKEYNQLLVEELSNISIDTTEVNQNKVIVKEDTLEDTGAKVAVAVESEDNTDSIPGFTTFASSTTKNPTTVFKKNGDHNYKIKYYITAHLYPDSSVGLVSTYKVKSSGISLTDATTAGTQAIFPTTIVASARVTDSKAEKVSYDTNAKGEYVVTIGGYNGIGFLSFTMTLESFIKWEAKASGGQKVKYYYKVVGDATK